MTFKKGYTPWNKGLTKEDPRVAKYWETRRKNDPNNLVAQRIVEIRKKNDPLNLTYIGRADKAWKTRRKRYGKSGMKNPEKFRKKMHIVNIDVWKIRHERYGKTGVKDPEGFSKKVGMRGLFKKLTETEVMELKKELTLRLNNRKRPNCLESRTLKIIQKFNLSFEYFGNKQQSDLGGKMPDFISTDESKKIIEIFGDYWHRGEDPQERIDYFKQYGYSCLVIWEHELNSSTDKEIVTRIKKFVKNG